MTAHRTMQRRCEMSCRLAELRRLAEKKTGGAR